MKNKHINQFLENNPKLDITVRLFDSIVVSKTDMKIFEHRKFGKGRKIVNILFHKTYKNKKSYYYYFWIKNINNIKKTLSRNFVCTVCYDKFSTNTALNRHLISCNSMTNEVYPPDKTYLSFDSKKAAKYASPISIMGFADFETKLECINSKDKLEDTIEKNESFTIRKSAHKIVSFSLIFVDTDGKLIFEKTYCGENTGEHFFQTLDNIEERLLLMICKNKAPISFKSLSSEQLERFNKATRCEICHIKFDSSDRIKCKNLDHCHYSNKFRYASCTLCNLLNRSQNRIPIYFHNFCSYDSKLILNVINKNTKVRTPPKFLFSNLQKLRYLTYNSYKFKDSLEHLPSSLSKLVSELNNPNQNHIFPIFHQSEIIKSFLEENETKENVDNKIKLLTGGKGIYPYSLCNDAEIMKKMKSFPKKEHFFNDLTNTTCSLEDYDFAKNVYKSFNCKNFYEYTILYNHTDTLILAEIMMVYRKIIQDNFQMDINHFLGIPGLSFNIMLKISKVKLELISNPKICNFFRNSIRGGMSFIVTRRAKSDYIDSNVDNCNKRMTHIRYIDGNNLYGSQMLFDLPTEDYKLENKKYTKEIEKRLKNNEFSSMSDRGMFLEVDLEYPKSIHRYHEDFPMAPERYNVTYNELSPLNRSLFEKIKPNNSKNNFSEEKLIPTLHDREKYVLHVKCLIFYLSHGLILKKVHRIVSFKQEAFLKDYILKLTKLRSISAAKNQSFFVNVFKLLANSTYGKFAQNPNNFTHAKLCLNKKDLFKATNSSRFLHASIVNANVAIVECKPEKILYDSPFPVAATILDLAKLHLYYYYYDVLKPAFSPDRVSLIMTDTDSLIFSVNCQFFF